MSESNQEISWYLARDGKQHGPVTDAELRKMIELGYLKPTDLVWCQGWEDWQPATVVLPPPDANRSTPAPVRPAPAPATASLEQAAAQRRPSEPQPQNRSAADAARAQPQQHSSQAQAPHHQTQNPAPRGPELGQPGSLGHGAQGPGAQGPGLHGGPTRPSNDGYTGQETQQARQPQPTRPEPQPRGPAGIRWPDHNPDAPGAARPGQIQSGRSWDAQTRDTHSRDAASRDHHHRGMDPVGGYAPGAKPGASGAGPGAPGPGPQQPMRPDPRFGPASPQHPSPSMAAHPDMDRLPPAAAGTRDEPLGEFELDDEEERRGFPWRLAVVLVLFAGMAGGGYALWKGGQLSALPFLSAPERRAGQPPVVSAPKAPARAATPSASASAAPTALEADLLKSRLWQLLKRDYPEWYSEQMDTAARMAGESKDQQEIKLALTRAIVGLRRKWFTVALQAPPDRLRAIAGSFVDNLTRLKSHSTAACYGFISQGETSPAVTAIESADQKAGLEAQLLAIFSAVADAKAKPTQSLPPKREDYDALTSELGKRGWNAADLQLFSDARALAQAAPEKVCQMVTDWFAAQLALKDEDVQIRLMREALKPVVAG